MYITNLRDCFRDFVRNGPSASSMPPSPSWVRYEHSLRYMDCPGLVRSRSLEGKGDEGRRGRAFPALSDRNFISHSQGASGSLCSGADQYSHALACQGTLKQCGFSHGFSRGFAKVVKHQIFLGFAVRRTMARYTKTIPKKPPQPSRVSGLLSFLRAELPPR